MSPRDRAFINSADLTLTSEEIEEVARRAANYEKSGGTPGPEVIARLEKEAREAKKRARR